MIKNLNTFRFLPANGFGNELQTTLAYPTIASLTAVILERVR